VVADYTGYSAPNLAPSSIPTLPSLSLSDDERELIGLLQGKARQRLEHQLLCDAYYRGTQIVDNLKIAVPDNVAIKLRTLVGWPRKGVDPMVDRIGVDGFRLSGETDVNQDLGDLWIANGMDAEFSIGVTDSLVMGSSYLLGGSGESKGDAPVMTVESPANMSVLWGVRNGRQVPRAALQQYWDGDVRSGALMLPSQTAYMVMDEKGNWTVTYRDRHNFGWVPVERLPNRPRSSDREGFSEITPSVMSITDAACRTLLGLEVSREIYSVPKIVLLGALASDFEGADGAKKTAFETYMSRISGLERDADGELPQIHQLAPYDPSVFTKLIEMYASQMAGEFDATPQEFGLYTQGNPTSAEAAAVNQANRDRTARAKERTFAPHLANFMKMGIRLQNNGALPTQFERISVEWDEVAIETPGVTSDAITKQIASGYLPARSDVTGKKLRYTAVQRAQIEQDRLKDEGQSMLQEIAHSLDAKALRVDTTVVKDAQDPNAVGATPNVMPKKVPVRGNGNAG
jgi:hypothetical protein